MAAYSLHDVMIGGQINAKGLLAEQVFARLNNIDVEPLMQIVWHSTVDGIDLRAAQQIVIVLSDNLECCEIVLEPAEHGGIGIADADDTWHNILLQQMAPAGDGACKLTSHQAAANNAKFHFAFLHDSWLLSLP